MKKLKLDIELLRVDTFDALPDRMSEAGSIRGHESTELCEPSTLNTNCCSGEVTCDTCNSCQDTTRVGGCFCTECVTCWDCAEA